LITPPNLEALMIQDSQESSQGTDTIEFSQSHSWSSQEEYELEKILNSRIADGRVEYLAKWKSIFNLSAFHASHLTFCRIPGLNEQLATSQVLLQ
jgi:hypothetical protein